MDLVKLNYERTKTAYRLGQPDQVPFGLGIGGWWITGWAGVAMNEYTMNSRMMLEAQRSANERLRGLIGYWPDFGVVLEVSGLGAKIRIPQDSPPWVEEPLVKRPEDADRLQVPDLRRDGLFPQYWKTWDYMESKGVDLAHGLYYTVGPLDQAALLRGVTQFMDDLVHNVDLVHRMLKVTTETSILFLRALEERTGELPGRTVFVADDFGGFMSPRMFRDFEMKYTSRIYNSFSSDYLKMWHSDSDKVLAVARLLPEMRVNAMFAVNGDIEIEKLKKDIGGKVCLIGNIHTLKILLRGKQADVEEASRQCIQKAAGGGGFVLAPGGEVIRGTPIENIEAMIESASKYGKYPIKE